MSKPAESDLQHVAESVSMPNPVDLSFLIHTIPDIPRDASIIGLCTIPKSLADPEAQGWHLSAFAAWKTLLGKAFPQNPQAWLSAVDGWFCSPLVFGGKRVNEAFDVKDVKIIEDPKNLAVEFLLEIEQKVAVAAGKKPIVVIICGPTSLGQDIPIGLDVAADQRATVTIKQIKQSSKGAKQLMLVTPSMLAATWWLVNPHLNQTASTAAASHIPPNTGKTPIVTVNLVKMYARRCTLLFMDQLISDVFSGKTLFLHPKYEYEDGANSVIKMPSLRPMFPTKEQKAAAALLSQATRQALYNNIAPIPVVDGFFFFPKSDRWTSTIMPRKGLSLLHYQQIWDELLDATPPMLSSAFPHGFGHAEASSSDTAQLSVTGEPPSRLATDIDSQPAGVSKASHEHWLNVRHMNAAYKLAAISLADAVVFFSKMEQPQGQSCIRWNPTTAESICLANATERVWFRKFIKEIKLCSIFQNPNFGKEYFGLRHHDAMIPDDGTALLRLYGRPVMYMWQAFKLKHIGLIQKTPNIDQSPKTRAILNGLPEVLDGKIWPWYHSDFCT